MTTTPTSTTPTTPTTTDLLSAALTDVQAQLGRVDTKASMLLAGSLMATSAGIAVLAKNPLTGAAAVAAIATIVTVALAVTLLITAVRPALRGNHGFVRWAAAPTPAALLNDLNRRNPDDEVYHAHRLLLLSRSVQRKYRLVRHATDLMRAALVLAVLTAILTTFA